MQKALQDRRKSICLFCLVFTVYSLTYMAKNSFSAAMAEVVAQGVMTKSQTGNFTALFYLFYAPLQIVGGVAADRYPPKHLILIGTLGSALCNLLIYCFSGNYVAMLIIWSANAIVQFGVWPAVFKIMASQMHVEHRGSAVALISISSNVGLLLSYVGATFATDWRTNFVLSTAALFVSFAIFWVFYSQLERDMIPEVTVPTVSDGAASEENKDRRGRKELLIATVKSGVPLLLLVYFVMTLLNFGLKSLAPVMLMESYASVTPSLANALNILLVIASPVGIFLAYLPVWKRIHEVQVIGILALLTLPPVTLLAAIGRLPLSVEVGAMVMIIVILSISTVFFMMTSKIFEVYGGSGTLAGIFNCMASVGIMAANAVFTRVAEHHGWTAVGNTWVILAAIALVLSLATIPLWGRFLKGIRGKTQVKD